jgi:hypothetical protein
VLKAQWRRESNVYRLLSVSKIEPEDCEGRAKADCWSRLGHIGTARSNGYVHPSCTLESAHHPSNRPTNSKQLLTDLYSKPHGKKRRETKGGLAEQSVALQVCNNTVLYKLSPRYGVWFSTRKGHAPCDFLGKQMMYNDTT